MRFRAIALLLCLLMSACGEAPGVMTEQRVDMLQSKLAKGGIWKCDRWAGGWGGSLAAGVKFGVWLSTHKVAVEIPEGELCASAAAMAAMGAPRLAKSPAGVLAFHGPTPGLTLVQEQALKALLILWSVPEPIALRIMALAPGEFWIPTGADLELLLANRSG